MKDCDNTAFKNFINDGNNIDYVKSFMEYKNGIDVTAARASVINDEIREISDLAVQQRAVKWYERSLRVQNNLSKFKKANTFGDANSGLIKQGANPPCGAWGGNTNKVAHTQLNLKSLGNSKHIVLDDGIVDLTPVGYYGPNNDLPIYRVIYHDSKLTGAAGWTANQQTEIIDILSTKTAPNDFIEFEVRSDNEILQKVNGNVLQTGSRIRIYKSDVYKSISIDGGQTISQTNQLC